MKKTKFFLLAILVHIQCNVFAQNEAPQAYVVSNEYNLWNKAVGDQAYVFADVAYIRDYPSTSGKLVDSLQHGSIVKIISEGYNQSTIRGFEAPWHKVEYSVNGKNKTGFIWLGLLALSKETNNKGEQFLIGFLKRSKDPMSLEYLVEIKAFDNNSNLIARSYYPATLGGQTYVESKVLPNMGLENLQSIHRIGFLGEACGISSNHYYFGWNGQEMIPMLDKSSVSDAGVFYYNETILFPSEHKLDNVTIIKDIEEGEVIDDEAEVLQYKVKKERKEYRWDGKNIAEVMYMK